MNIFGYIGKGSTLKLKFKNKAMHCTCDHQEQMKREPAAKGTHLDASQSQRPCSLLLLPNAKKINLYDVLPPIDKWR